MSVQRRARGGATCLAFCAASCHRGVLTHSPVIVRGRTLCLSLATRRGGRQRRLSCTRGAPPSSQLDKTEVVVPEATVQQLDSVRALYRAVPRGPFTHSRAISHRRRVG